MSTLREMLGWLCEGLPRLRRECRVATAVVGLY
jgi:hypothetical protein